MSSSRKRLHAKEIKAMDSYFRMGKKEQSKDKVDYIFRDAKSSDKLDREDVARIALFQSMIGNTDWFLKNDALDERSPGSKDRLWYIKILQMPDGRWVAFPQDFNFSGIILGSQYTTLNKNNFGIVDKAAQVRLKEDFLSHKSEIYESVKTLRDDPVGIEQMTRSLDAFYKTLPNF